MQGCEKITCQRGVAVPSDLKYYGAWALQPQYSTVQYRSKVLGGTVGGRGYLGELRVYVVHVLLCRCMEMRMWVGVLMCR